MNHFKPNNHRAAGRSRRCCCLLPEIDVLSVSDHDVKALCGMDPPAIIILLLDGFVGCHLQRKEVDEGDTTAAVDWSNRIFLLHLLLNILVEVVGFYSQQCFSSLSFTLMLLLKR